MVVLANRVKVACSSTGTSSPITLGAAEDGFQTFAQGGIADGNTTRYVIEENSNFEIGFGVFNASANTLTRNVSESSNSGNAINLAGAAKVFITATTTDIQYARKTTTEFTATSGQTSFTVSHDVGLEMVFLNGVMLVDGGTDYTANGSTIVLATGATAGDLLSVVAFEGVNLADLNATDDFGLITGSATVLDDFGSITGS